MNGAQCAVRLRGVCPQVGRGDPIAFDRRDAGAAVGPGRDGEKADARIQVEHVALERNRFHDVSDELIDKVSVALKERQHVALEQDRRMAIDDDRIP